MTIEGHYDHTSIWAYISHEYHIQVIMLEFPFVYLFHNDIGDTYSYIAYDLVTSKLINLHEHLWIKDYSRPFKQLTRVTPSRRTIHMEDPMQLMTFQTIQAADTSYTFQKYHTSGGSHATHDVPDHSSGRHVLHLSEVVSGDFSWHHPQTRDVTNTVQRRTIQGAIERNCRGAGRLQRWFREHEKLIWGAMIKKTWGVEGKILEELEAGSKGPHPAHAEPQKGRG